VAFWRTKAAISLVLVRVKIEEKLLWKAYRNSPMLFGTVPSPTLDERGSFTAASEIPISYHVSSNIHAVFFGILMTLTDQTKPFDFLSRFCLKSLLIA